MNAQTGSNSIQGFVADSISKAPMDFATVYIPKLKRGAVTNSKGYFKIDSLKPGKYKVQIRFIGYHELDLEINTGSEIKIELCPAAYHFHSVHIRSDVEIEDDSTMIQNTVTISQTQLRSISDQTISSMLTSIAGVNTFSSGPTIDKPVIHGLHSQRVSMLNAGVKQEGQQWGAEHGPEIDPFQAAGVKLIKGAAGVRYGPEAIGGVIIINPRDYRTSGIGGEISLNALSNNRQGAGALLLNGTHFKEDLISWRIQFSGRKAGDSRAPDYIISNTGFENFQYNSGIRFKKKRITAEFQLSKFQSKLGIFQGSHLGNTTDLLKALSSAEPIVQKAFTYKIGRPYQDITHEVQSVFLKYDFNFLRAEINVSRQLNHRKEFDIDLPYNKALREQNKPAFDLLLSTYSGEFRLEQNNRKKFNGSAGIMYSRQGNLAEGVQFIIPNFKNQNLGIYFIEKFSRKRFRAEAGIRYDKRDLQVYQNISGAIIQGDLNYESYTGVLGFNYHLNSKNQIGFNISNAWRPPGINELFSNGLHGGTATYEIGNSNLKNEKSTNFDLNFKHRSEHFDLEIDGYYNYINNFIYQEPSAPILTIRGAFPVFRFTQSDALLKGIDLNTNFHPGEKTVLYSGISILKADNINKKTPLIFMPANRIRTGFKYYFTYKFFRGSYAGFEHLFVNKQHRVPAGDFAAAPKQYSLFSFNAGTNIKLGSSSLILNFSVDNIFNTSYRDYLNRFRYFTDEAGRNIIIRLTIPFEIFNKAK